MYVVSDAVPATEEYEYALEWQQCARHTTPGALTQSGMR